MIIRDSGWYPTFPLNNASIDVSSVFTSPSADAGTTAVLYTTTIANVNVIRLVSVRTSTLLNISNVILAELQIVRAGVRTSLVRAYAHGPAPVSYASIAVNILLRYGDTLERYTANASGGPVTWSFNVVLDRIEFPVTQYN